MRNQFMWMLGCLLLLVACEPVMDDKKLGGILSESELQLEVRNTTDGGNEILMINNTPGIGSYWNYVTGVSTKREVTTVLPFLGEQTITFIGICDGGTVVTTRTVNITKIDHPVDENWTLFAGSGISGKSWGWNVQDYPDNVYGSSGWLTSYMPEWLVVPFVDVEDADCRMVFDLNGGANLSKVDVNGNVLEKGTFSFDMSAGRVNPDTGEVWSIGQLVISGVTLLSGHNCYDASSVVTTFQILELTEDTMVLCEDLGDAEAWMDATFWCLRKL